MKKTGALVLVLLLLLTCVPSLPLHSHGAALPSSATLATCETYTYTRGSHDTKILYVGGHGPNNFSRIQDAIDRSNEGDTILVFDDSSPYYENIVVHKSLELIGENRGTTIIDAGGSGDVVEITIKRK